MTPLDFVHFVQRPICRKSMCDKYQSFTSYPEVTAMAHGENRGLYRVSKKIFPISNKNNSRNILPMNLVYMFLKG